MTLAWLRLARAALAPTLLWDVVAGAWLAGVLDATPVADLLLASVLGLLVYHAGMILNDWADLARDRRDRPDRPLPRGEIGPAAAAAAGFGMLGLAAVLATLLLPALRTPVLALAGIVLLYDLGGPLVRLQAGPALLACARAVSLNLGAAAALGGFLPAVRENLWPTATYAVFFLFLSRLAASEERGTRGMRGLSFVLMAAASPLLLLNEGREGDLHLLHLVVGWMALVAWLLPGAWRDRHRGWDPQRVQAAVRRGLAAAPAIPGLALLARGQGAGGLVAVATAALVVRLARRLPPS